MINKRRKFLPRKLKYYRTPISKIPHNLYHGELISVTEDDGSMTLLSYRGKSRGTHEFLLPQDFLDQVSARAKIRQQDRLNAENDPFILYIKNLKVEKGCANSNCPCRGLNFEHFLYDYDHIDKSKKTADICKLTRRYKQATTTVTKEKIKKLILQEIENCQILCVVCHRTKSYEEKNGDHISFSDYSCIYGFLIEKNLSPKPRYNLSIKDFTVTSK